MTGSSVVAAFAILAGAITPAAAGVTRSPAGQGPGGTLPPVRYAVAFPNAPHHEAEITVRFPGIAGDTLRVRMSVSSPGRYARMEFARNVYGFRAFDGGGKELAVARPDPHQWDIAGHDGTVEIRYTLFGDRADGTFTGIDATHAHLNMPATFAWAMGMEERGIEIGFLPPAGSGWKAATQLFPTHHPMMFTAPDLEYFLDSPTELSAHTLRSWRASPDDTAYTFRMALHHNGSEAEADAYAAMCRRIVGEARMVFGEYPAFDNREYAFIVDYLPWVAGDGMEHRNSTSITSTGPLSTSAAANVSTVAHEFFHAWNVERIRPKSLQPFDLAKSNMSGELWFAEGFTNYYDRLIRKRAGITGIDRFAAQLGSTLDGFLRSPGRRHFSAEEMSRMAALIDGATFPDRMNSANTWYSYYPFGDMIALALDLTLRSRSGGTTLDDYMRSVWAAHGRTEVPYEGADLARLLGVLTNDVAFARDFFSRYVSGRETADYAALLAPAGLLLRRTDSGKASIGHANLEYRDGRAIIASAPAESSPIFRAGLDLGDTILAIGERPIASGADLDSLLSRRGPGDELGIEYAQRGVRSKGTLRLAEAPEYEVVTYERAGTPLTEEHRRFREAWLGSLDPRPGPALAKYCRECRREYPFEFDFCHYDGKELNITRE